MKTGEPQTLPHSYCTHCTIKLQTSVQFYHVHRQIARELNHFFVWYVRKNRITEVENDEQTDRCAGALPEQALCIVHIYGKD